MLHRRTAFYLDKVVRPVYENHRHGFLCIRNSNYLTDRKKCAILCSWSGQPHGLNCMKGVKHNVKPNEQLDLLKILGQFNRTISIFEKKYDNIEDAPPREVAQYSTALEQRFILFQELGDEEFHNLERLNQNRYQRIKRLQHRISKILRGFPMEDGSTAVFLTFTFDDDALHNVQAKYRRNAVTRWLKEHSVDYVANIDFGKVNGREHFHAVAYFDSVQDLTSWKYGALNCKKVPPTDEGKALSKYVAKLGAHAVKDSTKRSALIYSRSNHEYGKPKEKYNPYENA